MDIPLPFGLVRHRLYAGVGDTADIGRAPDMLGMIGEVDFTCTQTEYVTNPPNASTIVMQKITGVYVAGVLTYQTQEDVPLTASLNADGTPTGRQWKATYRVTMPDGTAVVMRGHNFDVPVYDENAELDENGENPTIADLSKFYSPLPPSGNMQFVKGDKGDKGDPGDPGTGTGGGDTDLSDYYTKEQTDTLLDAKQPAGAYAASADLDNVFGIVTDGTTGLDTKAPKANPTLTGDVVIPTYALSENSQKAASTAYVVGKFNALFTQIVGTAPSTLDTLQEIAAQMATDETAVSALTTLVGTKVPQTRTVNGHALSADVTLAATDISGITAVGQAVLAAASADAARQALGIYFISSTDPLPTAPSAPTMVIRARA